MIEKPLYLPPETRILDLKMEAVVCASLVDGNITYTNPFDDDEITL